MIIVPDIICYFSQTKNNMVIINKTQTMKIVFIIMMVIVFQNIFLLKIYKNNIYFLFFKIYF